jgi:hypothetical protein
LFFALKAALPDPWDSAWRATGAYIWTFQRARGQHLVDALWLHAEPGGRLGEGECSPVRHLLRVM